MKSHLQGIELPALDYELRFSDNELKQLRTEVSELCKLNPHVKLHKVNISYSSCSFNLVQCSLRVNFGRRTYLGISM